MAEPMAESPTPAAETLEYRTEVKQLLDILAHSLYTDREIFLRELISNASDALNRVQFEMLTNHDVLDADAPLAIEVRANPDAKALTISDSGTGMSRDELVENLGTIAHSGARAFLQHAGEGKAALEEIIGQFGVGFYSVFMVAQEVVVTTRSYRSGEQAWTWRSAGDSRFTLEPAEKTTRGTEVHITLKEDAAEFANPWRLEQIVKTHSDYVSFPIYVVDETAPGEERAPANRQSALWRQPPSKVTAEEYVDFYKQLTLDSQPPLLHIHMVADTPASVRSILYAPAQRERSLLSPRADFGLRLYSRKVLIQPNNKDLLPEYLRFVEGVVDSDDLPLNVSREMVQSNPIMRQLRKALSGRVLRELKSLAEKEPEKYATLWEQFGVFLKEGIATDMTSHEQLAELLRFRSTRGGDQWTSLKEYAERMGPNQEELYYILADDLKTAARSPHLDTFRANEIEVLFLVDPIDAFMISALRQYAGKPLRNIDDAGLKLPAKQETPQAEEQPPLEQGELDALLARVQAVLGERVAGVRASQQLVTSPVRLVSPEDSFDRDLQRVRRFFDEEFEMPKKLLELNRSHPLIVQLAHVLAATPDDALVDQTIEQLYDNALLLEGLHPKPSDMVERIQALMEAAVGGRALGK